MPQAPHELFGVAVAVPDCPVELVTRQLAGIVQRLTQLSLKDLHLGVVILTCELLQVIVGIHVLLGIAIGCRDADQSRNRSVEVLRPIGFIHNEHLAGQLTRIGDRLAKLRLEFADLVVVRPWRASSANEVFMRVVVRIRTAICGSHRNECHKRPIGVPLPVKPTHPASPLYFSSRWRGYMVLISYPLRAPLGPNAKTITPPSRLSTGRALGSGTSGGPPLTGERTQTARWSRADFMSPSTACSCQPVQ